jgi:hypothetical protein
VLASPFWNRDGILFVDYLENGVTITAKYYIALLDKLKQQLVSKHRDKPSELLLFLQDPAGLHKAVITHQKSVESDLAHSDYYLFS